MLERERLCAVGPDVTAYVTVISQRRRRVLAEELAACSRLEAQLGPEGLRRAAAACVARGTCGAEYLLLNSVPGTAELSVVCGALIGAGLGFLWFNAPPAQIFMGDTGSLALGGALGSIAVATKHEIVLAIIGGLFVLETVSVIVQVTSFRLTGKRVFRMAPIHHHFEHLGWTESQVVIRFWIISFVLALIGLSSLKLR